MRVNMNKTKVMSEEWKKVMQKAVRCEQFFLYNNCSSSSNNARLLLGQFLPVHLLEQNITDVLALPSSQLFMLPGLG